MIYLRYAANGSEPVIVKIPGDKDPFEVCNAVRERLFPEVRPPKVDRRFNEIMAARKCAERQ